MSPKVPHRVECLTLFLDSSHCRDRIATNVCERGSRGRRDWPGLEEPDPPYLAIDWEKKGSEGGRARGRCYSFLKLSPTARRVRPRPALGPAAANCDEICPSDPWPGLHRREDPCSHVSIAVNAGHPTGACKVPLHRREDVSSRAGRLPRLVCTGISRESSEGVKLLPNIPWTAVECSVCGARCPGM